MDGRRFGAASTERDGLHRGLVRMALLVASGLVVLVCASVLLLQLDERPLPSTRIDGAQVPRSGSLESFLDKKARIWTEQSLTLETGYHVWRPTRAELGAALPVDEAAAQIRALGRSLNPLVALGALLRSYFGAGHALRWRPRVVDHAALDRYVQHIREQVDRLPTPGTSDGSGQIVEGLAGEALDVEATKRAIARAVMRGDKWLKVHTLVTPPLRSVRRFASPTEEATVLMMRQETEFRAQGRGRAINIELSARKLDGVVIMPGAELSFNEVVGKRTQAAGFAPAHELMNGEVVLGIGGGVCQTAGTLHAAAFFAGLIVEEYRPHSRLNQFAYLRPGLDTMVAWPDHVSDVRETKDMRVRNPYPFPIVVRASVLHGETGPSTLRVDLYGSARPFRVDFHFEELEPVPAGEVRRADASLPPGQQRLKQEALPGMIILRHRTIYMPTRRVEEVVRVSYPPTPRVLLVGAS